jgi:RNA polymerase sigma-70 factor (ECF subfamily)
MQLDPATFEQLKTGEPDAYGVLIEQFEGPLFRFFFCDHRNHHVAQEQTAETFAQLVRSLGRMRGGADKLRAFVFATARHVQLRRVRERKYAAAPLAEAFELIDERPSPAASAADREQVGLVLDAIGQFEEQVRNVLLLRFVEECSLEEIAESLSLPLGTVKSHIHRGRTRLRQIFVEKEAES